MYLQALIDSLLFIPANDAGATFSMWAEDVTLYAVWTLSVQPLTFDPSGYADINDPDDFRDALKVSEEHTDKDAQPVARGRCSRLTVPCRSTRSPARPSGHERAADFYDGKQNNIGAAVELPREELLVRLGYTLVGWERRRVRHGTGRGPGLPQADEERQGQLRVDVGDAG